MPVPEWLPGVAFENAGEARCRSRGLRVLLAVVLQENTRMLRLAERYGFRRGPTEFGMTHLVLDLDSLAA
jgi:hypothetical protein